MSKSLKNDRIFKRPLIWLFLLGLFGTVVYIFLPTSHFLEPFSFQINNPPPISTEQQPLPQSSIPENIPASTVHVGNIANRQTEEAQIQQKPSIATFVKQYQKFSPSSAEENCLEVMRRNHFNPVLISQLLPLKKRLQDPEVSSIEVLYADYLKDGKKDSRNSKIIAIRFHKGDDNITFFSKREKNGLFFYDQDGNAPELAMDRIPLSRYDRITSPFNPHRLHPITHRIRPHNGTDFKAPYGTPVRSTGYGTVRFAGWQRGYGKIVIIEHPNGYETRYAHLSAIKTKVGDEVSRGQVIGKLGNTGASTGAHLHYEVRIDNIPHDPMKIELPSLKPIEKSYMNAWKYRCTQQGKVMADLAALAAEEHKKQD